jgi:predicted DNA-binding transcriptional regulator AlpA
MARRTTTGTVPNDLRNFDLLPDSAHVRQPVVEGLYGCSGSTVWRMVKRGEMPPPHKITNRITGWSVGELRVARKT